ncbi:MAG: diguanylate cyclase [Rickettsiales bacterium]|nr:diguanylate cyclase [Rickettsiales bacterium]
MLNTYRRHDAVLIVCQDNNAQRIEVAAINEQAKKITGYSSEEVVGKRLHELVDDNLREVLDERIHFVVGQDDVADALMRVRKLSLKTKNGAMQEFRLRVVRSEVMDSNPTFHLVLEDERVALENDGFKEVLKENFRGHEVLEEQTGLPNRSSLMKDLELFQFFAKKREATACFAVLQLDNTAELSAMMGAQVPYQVLKHLGQLCAQRLRTEDTVGLFSGQALGLILMQITPESARLVLNRLRWSAASMPVILDTGKRVDPEISIAFHMIGEATPEAIMIGCEEQVRTSSVEGGSLHEVKI